MSLFRFYYILHICARYRLDRFLTKLPLPWYMHLWLSSWRFVLAPFAGSRHDSSLAVDLRLALQQLGPIFIKFGQFMSTRRDLLPTDIADELSILQDQVPPFSNDLGLRIIESELGSSCDQLFASIGNEVLASASVAQVYTAKLHNGDEVVVKVVRPDIEPTINKDLRLLHRLTSTIERWWRKSRAFHLNEIVNDYQHTILNELDMMSEAASCSQLGRNFKGSSLLYVPKVYWSLCSSRVLTLERIYGIPVNQADTLAKHKVNLKRLAEKGVEIFFTQVFDHSFFHADMHPGNIFVSLDNPQDPQYVGVDFGIMGSLSDEDQYYLAHNLLAFFHQDYHLVAKLHVRSGWVSPDTKIHELESAIRTVCEPIFQLPLKDISFGKLITRLFQTARRFNMEVQPQLVLLDKTLFNIEGLGRQLYPDLDLWTTAKPFMERWIKRRSSPQFLWQRLKVESIEWLERLPELPRKVNDTMQQVQLLDQNYQHQREAIEHISKAITKQTRLHLFFAAITLVAVSVAGWSYFY